MGLDNARLWDDEGYVALIAKNYAHSGQLSAWDGRNFLGYHNGSIVNQDWRITMQPLDVFITGISFKLLGVSTFTARLPHVIIGILALLLFVLILEQHFKTGYWLKFFILMCLAFSYLYLLNIRQCRYYSLSMLTGLFSFYFYERYLKHKRAGDALYVALGFILSFAANPLLCMAFLCSLMVYHVCFERHRLSKSDYPVIGKIFGILLLGTVPYYFLERLWELPNFRPHFDNPWYWRKLTLLWWYLRDINMINALPWMGSISLLLLVSRRGLTAPDINKGLQLGVLGLLNLLFVVLFTLQPTNVPIPADTRYLILSIPFFCVWLGVLFYWVKQSSVTIAIVLLLVFQCTTVFTLHPFNRGYWLSPRFHWLLPAFINEIHNPYPTGYDGALRFLASNASHDDVICLVPDYFNNSMMFYAGNEYLFGCQVDEKTHLNIPKLKSVAPYLFKEETFPQWIISFGLQDDTPKIIDYYSRAHLRNGKPEQFAYPLYSTEPYYWDQTQRPEIYIHSFGPHPLRFPDLQSILIYKRTTVVE